MPGRLSVFAVATLAAALATCAGQAGGQQAAATTQAFVARDGLRRCVGHIASKSAGKRTTSLRAIAREVERLRHLRFRRIPRPRYLNGAALARRIRAEFATYPDAEAAADGIALTALGAIPRGTNLKAVLRRAQASQTAGFYDPKTGELVVGAEAKNRLDPEERVTLAHELDHALTDQALVFPAYLEAEQPAEGREDAALAGLALIEGDATLLMEAYATKNLSLGDVFRTIGSAFAGGDDFEELPYFLRANSLFPYLGGVAFVCRLYALGGWKAVDRAYRNPPTTTAQVLFPDRYLAREGAAAAPRPQPPAPGWSLLDTNAIGAADLLWLFEAPGGETSKALSHARRRAAAWAGGEVVVWARGSRRRVTLTLVERRGERDLCTSVRSWFKAAERRGAVRCSGRIIRANLHP